MNHIKLGAVILILTAGLAGGYLIIKNSKPAGSGSYITFESSGEVVENSQKSPIQWVEKARDFISHPIEELKKFSDKTVSEPAKETGLSNSSLNLTDFVAKSVSGQIQYLSQSGEDFDPDDPKNQELIEKAMADLSSASLFDETLNNEDLKISSDNSKEAKAKYLSETAQIILKNFSDPDIINFQKAFEKLVDNFDASGVGRIANAYSKILDGLISIETPPDYLDLHKRYIILLKKAKEIFQGIVDYNNDPVRAGLSMQLVPKIAEAELEIKQEYYQKSLNLNF